MLLPATFTASLLAPVGYRPPAVPLVVCDPYFSVWSCADRLTDDWPRHWTGAVNALQSMIRVDGLPYRLMGPQPAQVPAADQLCLELTPTRTTYTFACGGVEVALTFLTPAIPGDLDRLGRPIVYLTWSVRATDGQVHQVQLYFDHSGELVIDQADQQIAWDRPDLPGLTCLRLGSAEQQVLGRKGDNLRIDWGYLYSATADRAVMATVGHETARLGFAQTGRIPALDDRRQPRAARDEWPVAACCWDLGRLDATATTRTLVLAYDELYSIQYLGQPLRPYWRRSGWGPAELLQASFAEHDAIAERCAALDQQVIDDLRQAGGGNYVRLGVLAFRQCLAGHTLAVDPDGTPCFFSKECFSNGCIATVDVTYPTAPFMLKYNPALLRAMLEPLLRYAATDRWKFPFAPHDLGQYPLADGQVYGGGEETEDRQMPVEECGNLLILAGALAAVEGSPAYAKLHWSVLTTWAEYLKDHGLDPENQLCTDDFSGHLAHNANLSIKAILALACYGRLCEQLGETAKADEYGALAKQYAGEWLRLADDGDHTRLAFDQPGTWSQKYNLVWDRLLGFDLFPPELARQEVAFYLQRQNRYGLPLDNRADFTKTDWIVWSATLAERRADFDALLAPVAAFLNDTPDRVPLTDWYFTSDAKKRGFQARPVVGGVFVKLLADGEGRLR